MEKYIVYCDKSHLYKILPFQTKDRPVMCLFRPCPQHRQHEVVSSSATKTAEREGRTVFSFLRSHASTAGVPLFCTSRGGTTKGLFVMSISLRFVRLPSSQGRLKGDRKVSARGPTRKRHSERHTSSSCCEKGPT